MSGEEIKQSLDGLSKIDGLSEVLFGAIYWLAVLFVMLFIGYLFSCFVCYLNRKRYGNTNDSDDFLDD